jgi:hypothetical protein
MESYLLFQLKKISFSLKSSMRAGYKPYAVDTGLRNRVVFSFSEDLGWLTENGGFNPFAHLSDDVRRRLR